MTFDIHIRIDESLEVITISGAEYYKGDKGDDFTYEDFTPEQIEALKVKGDPFLYSDFTPAQIAELQRPATEAVTAVNEAEALRVTAETTRVENEQGRVTAEGTRLSNEIARENSEEDRDEAEALRLSAEITRGQNEQARITAEGLRVDAESTRQTNTATAITNANNAASNANTKAGLADTAANNANEKATLANNAAILANEKAGLANTAATNADNARLAIAGELALKVDKSTQGMKLLADYTHNTNIVLPQVQSIDYATSTVTFTVPHGFTVAPHFYSHICDAYINDYRIKTNYKAVPSGLQIGASLKIAEIISPTALRFSNVLAGTTYALPNANPTDVDFSMWHFEYIPALRANIIIENSVAVKAVVMARSQHGPPYMDAIGNETSKENIVDGGAYLGLGTAYWERDYFIAGDGLLVSRTSGTGNTIRSAGLAKVTYDAINTWRYNGITYINKIIFNNVYPRFGNGTRILIYKLA